jgi:inhibitor of KinA sporulation pathway (predicted exonuclease)
MTWHRLTLDEFLESENLLLLDLEYTCWEDSLATDWEDPNRPPEVIEIGLASYSPEKHMVAEVYSSYIRPRLNPHLSKYCLNLLNISQDCLDGAPSLAEALWSLVPRLNTFASTGYVTCSWGVRDRLFLAQDANRVGLVDPFACWAHADIGCLCRDACAHPESSGLDRDAMRTLLALQPNKGRHRAMDDALDLVQFCEWLRGEAYDENAECEG